VLSRVSSAVSELVEKTSPQLAKPLEPTNNQDADRLRNRLSYAGFRSEHAKSIFLAAKIVCMAAGFFLGGGTLLLAGDFSRQAMLRVVICASCGFFVPDVILKWLTKRRQEQLFFGLPDAIDLMVVCVEAGLGLDQSMRKVADEMRKSFPAVSHEFELSTLHLQMGLSRVQVFRDLGQRNGEEDLRSLTAVLIHASRFGTGIGLALRNHGEAMRVRRRQLAEERASKSAVKLIFPLVLFIFPAIFVVLVGPAAINIVRVLLPTMTGR
jgi:tight adherence protein C